jgi:osmoprotectant transport system permease protein
VEALQDWWTYVQDNREVVIEEFIAHARIVLIVIACSTVFSVLLGVLVYRLTLLRNIVLAIAGIFLTIPSLALFALFIPVVGIGNLPAMMALFLYAILPILRNTVTGMDSVSPAVVESAKGMGMSWSQQLTRVRLPLAWPVIMAGIRVSSLMVVGIAAIAVLVGGDGLGEFIRTGVNALGFPFASYSVWTGVVFTVILGLLLDMVFALVQRLTTSRGLRI